MDETLVAVAFLVPSDLVEGTSDTVLLNFLIGLLLAVDVLAVILLWVFPNVKFT